MSKIYKGIDQLIGKTPVVELTNIEEKFGLNSGAPSSRASYCGFGCSSCIGGAVRVSVGRAWGGIMHCQLLRSNKNSRFPS